MPLSYASDSGEARICQRGAIAKEQSDQAGGGCGRGFPFPRWGDFFFFSCMKIAFSCSLKAIMGGGGRLCKVAYTNPL